MREERREESGEGRAWMGDGVGQGGFECWT